MATYKNFEDLEIWQLSRMLCKKLHSVVTDDWFKIDNSLKGQILASSGSVMDNIAEGFERGSTNEFKSFLAYSKGSCGEFRSQIYRAMDKQMINQIQFEELKTDAIQISIRINRFINYLKNYAHKGNRFAEPQVIYGADNHSNPEFLEIINQYINEFQFEEENVREVE